MATSKSKQRSLSANPSEPGGYDLPNVSTLLRIPSYSAARFAIDTREATQTAIADDRPTSPKEDKGGDNVVVRDPERAATTGAIAAPNTKKVSMGLAVINAEFDHQAMMQSADFSRPMTIQEGNTEVTSSDSLQRAIAAPVDVEKPKLQNGLFQWMREEKFTRRFSLSSVHSTKLGPRRSRWSKLFKNARAEVSPEELQIARDPNANMHRFTIRHDSSRRYAWDIIVMIMILIDIVLTPLSIGFHLDTPFLGVFNIFGSLVFFMDFIVQIMSSYTDGRGKMVSGPYNTAKHYLLSVWAVPDFLGWFPFEHLTNHNRGRAFGITKVIRLAKVSQLARKLNSAKKAGALRFIRLLGVVFVTSHVLTCYWNWIAVEWKLHMDEGDFAPRSLGEVYALSWSLIIGCLNASPPAMYSAIEALSVAVFMLIGNLLQASVFGSVAVLISSFDEEEAAYNAKIITVLERCKFLGIPHGLSRRIRGYYENLWRETKSINTDADSFINELSPALICEIKFQLYRDMLKQIPFLSAQKVSPAVIEMLILHLRTVIYMQDDVLIRKGEFGDWMGFIGSKGSVGVLDPSTFVRKIIRILRKGDYFGEMALLQRAKRSTTAVALTWVQIHVLCRADLDNVKEQYPAQAEILEDEITKYMKSKVTYK